jgi:hypothetical protein
VDRHLPIDVVANLRIFFTRHYVGVRGGMDNRPGADCLDKISVTLPIPQIRLDDMHAGHTRFMASIDTIHRPPIPGRSA